MWHYISPCYFLIAQCNFQVYKSLLCYLGPHIHPVVWVSDFQSSQGSARTDGDASSLSWFFGVRSSSNSSIRTKSPELRCRFLPSPRSGEVRTSHRTCATTRFGVGNSNRFNGSTMANAASGRWPLRARAQRLFGCHLQGQAGPAWERRQWRVSGLLWRWQWLFGDPQTSI